MDWRLLVTLLASLINQSLSSPTGCSCFNPLIGKAQEYFGEPEYACENLDWCFVRCDGSCSDKEFMSGRFEGKCRSESACYAGSSPAKQSDSCKCGLHANLKWIVGGTETEKNEYPWQVGFVEKGDSLIWCGGSLISDSWVLTAAHCTEPHRAGDLQILLGHHDSNDLSRTIRSNVAQIVNHPKYDEGTHNNYDLSLVKLETKIDFRRTPSVRPVCLPRDDHNDYVGYKATVSGWGTVKAGGERSNVLLEVDVNVIDNDSCWKDFRYRQAEITEQMLCAHVEGGGKDSCQGDSGGPLVTHGSGDGYTAGQNHELIGVVSWGNGCAEADYPGVYSRVSKQLGWIEQVTAQGWNTCPRV